MATGVYDFQAGRCGGVHYRLGGMGKRVPWISRGGSQRLTDADSANKSGNECRELHFSTNPPSAHLHLVPGFPPTGRLLHLQIHEVGLVELSNTVNIP